MAATGTGSTATNAGTVSNDGDYGMYANGSSSTILNAGTVSTSATLILPLVSRLDIGSSASATVSLNGTLKRLAFYPKALPSNVQALTA
jgi:hypothetical protein